MLNKETGQLNIAKKKFNLVIAVVVLLMLVSFIALKIKFGDNKLAVVNTAKAPEVVDVQSEIGNDGQAAEKKINVEDIVSAEKLTATEEIKPIAKEDHIIGTVAEPVKLVVYSDFECSYCADFSDTVNLARKEFGDKLAVVFRHYPLISSHPYSLLAAVASECAADQGKFWEMHDELFAIQRTGMLDTDSINQAADKIKLAKPQFSDCLEKDKYKEMILEQVKEAKAATVSGSPTAFINGELITGANPYNDGTYSDGTKLEGLRSKILRKLEGK